MRKIIILIVLSMFLSGYTNVEFKISGYYPFTAKKHEKHIEGGTNDKFGNKLKVLRDNKIVSIAVDKRVIPLNSYLKIDAFPDKVFHACDIGGKIKGHKIDICVWDKKTAYNLPKKAKITIIEKPKEIKLEFKFDNELMFLKR